MQISSAKRVVEVLDAAHAPYYLDCASAIEAPNANVAVVLVDVWDVPYAAWRARIENHIKPLVFAARNAGAAISF